MTVGEMKKRLEQYEDDLPVALADWQEGYHSPSTVQAEKWAIRIDCAVNNIKGMCLSRVLVLGDELS